MASTTAAAPPEVLAKPAARILSETLGDRVLAISDFRGDLAITVARGAWVEAARLLKNHPELDFKLFLDLCAVDHLDRPGHAERFEVVLHVYSVSTKHHVRLKTPVPESDAKLAHPRAGLPRRELVRARGVGPLRHRLRGTPEPLPAPDPRRLRGPPDAQGLPDREAPRAQGPEGAPAPGPRGLRARADQPGALAPRDARHLPRPGAARRRDDHRGRGRDRLHAPQLREDGGGADLLADHPVHRPAQLLLVLHERARLGAGGREAAATCRRRRVPRRSA